MKPTNLKTIKTSETRILIFLENSKIMYKYANHMSNKLSIEYGYLIRLLSAMKFKKWVIANRRDNKVFYQLTNRAPIKEAKNKLKKTQHTLTKSQCI